MMHSLRAVVLVFTWLVSIAQAAPLDRPHLRLRDVGTVTVQLISTASAENTVTSTSVASEISPIIPLVSSAALDLMTAFLSELNPGFTAWAFRPSVSAPAATTSWFVSSSSFVASSSTSNVLSSFSSSSTPTTTPTPTPPVLSAVVGTGPASSSASCESENEACQGDVTHYSAGLGACGILNTDADSIIALPYGLMGDKSNGNPYCGRSVTIMNPNNGHSAQATVEDKCMGCEGRSIDLTSTLFEAVVGDLNLGRVHGVEWWFN